MTLQHNDNHPFPPYPTYKDSGVEWIGEIPKDWYHSKFGRISYMKGRIGWQGLKSSEFTDSGPYLITGMNFKDGKIRWDEVYHITEERYNEAPEIQLKEKDVLMTKDGTIGKLLYVDHLPDRASLNSHLLVFRPLKNDYIPKYLYYQLQSPPFKHHIELYKTGTTFYGITQSAVSLYKMLLPPIEEQTTIAHFLDHKTTQIDAAIDKHRQLIELLREHRAALINEAVTKGLNPDAPMKDSGVEWIREVPAHWEVKKIKHLVLPKKDAIKTGPFGSHLKNSDLVKSGVKVYNQRNVLDRDFDKGSDYITEAKYEELKGFRIFENDLLLTTRGTIGKCAIFPEGKELGVLHPCLIRMQLDKKKVDNKYLSIIIQNSQVFSESIFFQSNATTIEVIYGGTLKEIYIPLPELKEQQVILDFIESETTRIDREIDLAQQEIALLEEYRQALIAEAVTGKIDVRDYVLED